MEKCVNAAIDQNAPAQLFLFLQPKVEKNWFKLRNVSVLATETKTVIFKIKFSF